MSNPRSYNRYIVMHGIKPLALLRLTCRLCYIHYITSAIFPALTLEYIFATAEETKMDMTDVGIPPL